MPEDEWDPSKPLDDKEEEEEVRKTARARARLKHLESEELAKLDKKKKKSGRFDI